jgi:hypothetical protein
VQDGAVTTPPAPTSVYQRVLGSEFEKLDPRLRTYFSLPEPGTVGRGTGVYEVAGSRKRWLRPLFSYLAARRILFPEFGRDVPFTVTNVPGPGDGLSSGREFHFPGQTRLMEDTMHVIDGRLHDFLGRNRGLEVRFAMHVRDGGLVMVSDASWIHIGPIRIPLPRIFSARVVLNEWYGTLGQHVSVHLHNPIFGDLFEYVGQFTYRYEK